MLICARTYRVIVKWELRGIQVTVSVFGNYLIHINFSLNNIKITFKTYFTLYGKAKYVDYKRDRLWVRFPFEKMFFFYSVWFSDVEAKRATQHAMPPECPRKRETECLNIRFPLPSLLGAGYRHHDAKTKLKLNIISA